ncbi:hypothetical protein N7478_003503 [Penicillium angulare]|uniref:uncharacterized protein n=1 Tax=Penicillium angulare TaxID=116970 RepID=UPI0025404128|nr:uncharacterized protein N7478_003503 [Penicillium angulare]KAJ5287817.1 hypothetical protein N7478_003503 [Penicillium angulare]
MNLNEEMQSNPRKRRRPALSCEQCRRRKVRCDREMPCGPCSNAHPSLECSYVYEGKAVVEARLESFEPNENGFSSSLQNSQNASNGQAAGESARIAQLERGILALQGRVKDLEECLQAKGGDQRNTSVDHRLDGKSDRSVHSGDRRSGVSEQPQTFISPIAPRLKSDNGRVKLFGTTHWAIVFQQFRMLRHVRSTAGYANAEHNDISGSLGEIRKLRHHIKNCQSARLLDPAPNLLNDLPSREVCNELVQHYLRTLGLIYRVLHAPTFYQEYDAFWENPQAASRGFLLKLLLIIAIGSIFHCQSGPLNELGLPIQRWAYAAQWWVSGPFSKEVGCMEGLQVYCLLLLCRQAYSMDKETNWMLVGTLLRLGVSQGLHRDPVHFPTVSAFDAEMRRRVWATILELNIQLSIDVAMPPLINERDFDTRPPANVDDDDIDPTMPVLPPVQLEDLYTDSSLQIVLLKSFSIRLQIAKMINECGELLYEKALQLGSKLTAACKEMEALVQTHISRARSRVRPTSFHHKLMDTLLRRFLLNLYRPFTIQASKDPRFYLSRKLSLDSALVMASYGDPPTTSPDADLQPYQDFQRLAFSGCGLFKSHLSLDVIIVISLELITQLEEEYTVQPPGSTPIGPSAVDKIAQAARVPLFQALEAIKSQLYDSIAAGIPSMKRYCLLSGVLAQLQSAPIGEPYGWTPIREAFMDSMNTCRTLLDQYITQKRTTDGDRIQQGALDSSAIWTPESGFGSSLDSDFVFPGLGLEDLDFWDLPSFVDASAFDPPLSG